VEYLASVNRSVQKSKKKKKLVPFKYFVKNVHMDSQNMPNTAALPAAGDSLQPRLS